MGEGAEAVPPAKRAMERSMEADTRLWMLMKAATLMETDMGQVNLLTGRSTRAAAVLTDVARLGAGAAPEVVHTKRDNHFTSTRDIIIVDAFHILFLDLICEVFLDCNLYR